MSMQNSKTKKNFILTFLLPFIYGLYDTPLEYWESGVLSSLIGCLAYPFMVGGLGFSIGMLGFLNKKMSKEKKVAKLWSIAFYVSISLTVLLFLQKIN